MLRLRANTLWQVDGRHEAAYNKAVVDSFDICVAENYKVTEFVGKKHKKKHRKTIENVKLVCSDAQMEMSNLAGPAARNAQQQGLSGEQECPARQIAPLCRSQRRRLCLDSQHYQSEAVNLPASHDDEPGVE